MASTDLVTLSTVKSWLGLLNTDPARDTQLQGLISQISLAIYNWCNRGFFLPQNVTEYYDGNGRDRIQLRNWPVGEIISLYINGTLVPPFLPPWPTPTVIPTTGPVAPIVPPPGVFITYDMPIYDTPGYILEDASLDPPGDMQLLMLNAYTFWKGKSNVTVQYQAGYTIFSEPQTVPGTGPYTISVNAPWGPWGSNWSVTYASSGIVLVAVVGTPAAGQYSVSGGVYTFSSADASQALLISYGYIPADITQCALEWVQLRWAEKDRPGQVSKSLGGQETVSYKNEPIPKFIELTLNNFRRVAPI